MRRLVFMSCFFLAISCMYGVAYLLNFYDNLWWTNPTVTLGICMIATCVGGMMYSILEMTER